jgi:cellulose synthase/poly-beta-1,6-N-acetylglucosamine synthase-like glycosyltransferase/peptidoglycan/xylan/chitin deacetylase (PgdA/CDA1 family)
LVTQDVSPYNTDYNYKELAKYCDYIFLMAYDEYSDTSVPGPVSSQKWIEGAVDEAAKQISADKIILCLAAYGYDWADGRQGETKTYQEALTIAKENDGNVRFDNDTYNLYFEYHDEDSVHHKVYFTDAATNFNTLRFATEYGLAGTALWRLGSEDSRIWDFYDKDMRKEAISKLDFKEFNTVESSTDVDYIGGGEVLDIVATPKEGYITPSFDTAEMLISEERYDSLPSMFVVKKYGKAKPKQLVLTFDDGPDPTYTPQILDILSKYHVPAAFFMVGLNMEDNLPIVKRVYREGHEIGNHTFTHPNIAEVSKERAKLEMRLTRLLIECITGHSTIYFRAPYNADSEPESMQEMIPVQIARERNYLDIGESIDPEDWEPGVSADTIVQRVVTAVEDPNGREGRIILLHDAGGEGRKQTVLALPRIIEYFQKKGYTFVTVASLLGKTKDEVMPPMPKGSGYYLLQINLVLAEIGYWGGHFLASCFIVFMVLSCIRLVIMGVWSGREHAQERSMPYPVLNTANAPMVSIIVPAYNEEVNAVASLTNLLRQDYPNFNIIFVDDGSKDTTFEKVKAAFLGNGKVNVLTKPNGGKASALNYGIAQTDAEFVVCIDADTKLLPDAVSQLMKHYMVEKKDGSQVGAVAGYVKVGNEVNLLTRWQAIEYISSQNFDRLAFAHINAITVVPGAIGAFRSKALVDAGGFTTDTLAEDCDLSIRILRAGYIIENENASVALTEAPESLGQFMKQRVRWSFGVMQTFWKNRDVLFSTKYGSLGVVALPNILLFQFIIPFFSPLADIFMIIGIISGNGARIGKYYLIFMAVDAGIAVMAFFLSKESMRRLIWLIPQRLGYRWIMYVVLYRSIKKAVKGELQNWGVLKRTGNVTA